MTEDRRGPDSPPAPRPADEPPQEAPRPDEPAPAARQRSRRRMMMFFVLPLVGAIVAGIVGGIGVAAAIHMPRVEAVFDYQPTLITEFYSRDGELFTTYARERRVMLDEGEVPEVLENAIIAAEDSNFFQHGGIDAVGVTRAMFSNLQRGRRAYGASTLTMQLARMLFLSREKTWRRKIEEAFLAVELEKNLSKQQILTLYANLVNLGHGRYGMEAAARYFFNKSVDDLDVVEAATLAGIVQRPSEYSPYRRPDLVTKRRDYVLRRMAEEGFITREESERAQNAPLLVVQQRPQDQVAPYFAEEVRQRLETTYGASRVVEGGLQVTTTLDLQIQQATEQAMKDGLLRLDHRRGFRGPIVELDEQQGGALEAQELPSWSSAPPEPGPWYEGIVLDTNARQARVRIHDETFTLDADGISWTGRSRPSDLLSRGDVAWFRLEAPESGEEGEGEEGDTAGSDPSTWTLHLEQAPEIEGAALVIESATGAVRAMVGGWDYDRSKFNRAVQAQRQVGSAFKMFVYGAALEARYTPADTIFDGPTAFPGGDGRLSYYPRNHSRSYSGVITLRRALERSLNIPAVKLQDMVGTQRVIDFAQKLGVDSELPAYPSLALGAAEIRPIELAAAYAAIANQGTWVEPYLVDSVTTPSGRLLERHIPETRTGTSPEVAHVLTRMLEGVVDRGTATKLRDLDVAIAGKTGTTDDYSDAWFIGFTPRYTLLTWVGYDVKRSLGRGMDGSSAAAPIWKQIVEAGLADGWIEAGGEFVAPPGVVTEGIDYRSGLAGGGFQEAFVAGTQPTRPYSPERDLILSLPWAQQQTFYLPKEGERMPGDERRGAAAAAADDGATPETEPETDQAGAAP